MVVGCKLRKSFHICIGESRGFAVNEVENETVGYSGAYKVNGKEKIAIVPIGYADGIIRKNTGRDEGKNCRRFYGNC